MYRNRFNTRFSRRLSLYICGVVALLFILSAAVAIHQSVKEASQKANDNAFAQLDNISWEIENILRSTETAVETLAPLVARELTQAHPSDEKLFDYTRQLIASNRMIVGSIVALPPHRMNPREKFFAAYSFRDSLGRITSSQVGNENYDYTCMDWYLVPRLLKKPYWSDPYFDTGAGNIIMCTYAKPLFAPDSTFLGVLTADLPSDWLSGKVNSIKPYPSSYNLLIGKDGAYIVHTDPQRILRETILTATYEMPDTTVRFIGREMVSGHRGSVRLQNDDTTSMVYYTPIPSSGWSVSMVCPVRDIQAGTYRLAKTLIGILTVALVLIFLIANLVIERISRPLHAFSESARKIAGGNFNAPLPEIRSRDEMLMLKQSFEYMQTSLTRYIEELTRTTSLKERIESELKIAREIQMSMIPKIFPPFPNREGLDIYAYLKPAKEVGGDLYDFFIDGDRLCFAVGDVSGKGIPASLFMAVTRSIFRSVAGAQRTPSAIIRTMNNAMSDGNDANMFVTLFIGILDLRTGRIQYCNAGHNPPVLLRPDGTAELLEVSAATGVPVGIFPDFPYTDGAFDLGPRDRLILYTDGVTEAENRKAALYGEDRLLDTIRRNAGSPSIKDLLNRLVADIEAHVGEAPQSDDITVMILKNQPDKPAGELPDKPAGELPEQTAAASPLRKITLRNEISQLARLTEWVHAVCAQSGLNATQTNNINLALEEAATNIILYAYPESDGSRDFTVESERDGDTLLWRLTDGGTPFDPTAKEDADLSLGVEERPIGGLGIFLVKQLTDQVEYARINDLNVLTIKTRIRINPESEQP